ncbi:tol-like protein [Fusarium flagelliforme]|uniref:Tol-like protein n=1 Tax=Fusarium flagelliforme TaxID=2675880 RepID=A0A395MEE4_9HYPO|nr:tol-like protein [Fusarium flagelliforme]
MTINHHPEHSKDPDMTPTLHESDPGKIILPRNIRESLVNKTSDLTDDEKQERANAHCEPFLPNNEIQTFIQKSNVKVTLERELGRHKDNSTLVTYFVQTAPKAFLIAIYIKAANDEDGESCIKRLQQEGFTDAKLPIRTIIVDKEEYYKVCRIGSTEALTCFSRWDETLQENLEREQWVFLAPTFKERTFSYEFRQSERMPFVYLPNPNPAGGFFSQVLKLGLRVDHHNLPSFQLKREPNQKYVEVAVKFMNTKSNVPNSDVDKFYNREKATLELMRELNDNHLIRAIAAYKKGTSRCFIFPWAEGGNLDTFWSNDRSRLDKYLVRWAIDQMAGITGGIMKLHGVHAEGTRHGDIKPYNILYFLDQVDNHGRGTLKVADVGLAKVHQEYTKYRGATTTRMSTERYEPPEMMSYIRKEAPIPRVYDSWSLGGVFLEFLVWLVLGRARLDEFHQDLKDSHQERFYEMKGHSNPRHHVVNKLICDMEKMLPDDTGLGKILELISKSLLVPADKRMDTKTLHNEFDKIRERCNSRASYYFGSGMVRLAEVRPVPSGQSVNKRPPPDQYVRQQHLSLDPSTISFYVDPDDKGPTPRQAQLGLPVLPSPGSPQEFTLVNDWITLCDRNHDCVPKESEPHKMPTRLIDVGTTDSPSLRLVTSIEENFIGKYIALSHCWGILSEEQRFCTYKNNIQDLKQQIPYDKLPQTFKDAVTATRALEVRYLWIDSLCIIQRDPEDWEIEAARMEDVFNSAYCTIAASSSTSSLDGFLGKRRERAVIGINTTKGPLYLAEAIDNFQQDVEKGILNTRGWVFQERALSRRTIHFTSTQVYWECGHGVHSETLAHLRNRESELLGDSKFPNYGLQKYKDDSIRLVQYLYKTYSGLNLTNTTDRSKALLGLEKRLGRTFQTRAEYGTLSVYFERLLLWQRDQPLPLDDIPYSEGEGASSWSWMSLMGKISYLDIPFGNVNWTGDVTNPFNEYYHEDEVPWDRGLQVKARELAIGEDILKNRIRIDRTYSEMDPKEIICAVVGTSKLANDDGTTDQYVLLLRWTSPCVYERCGVGILLDIHIQPESFPVYVV